MQGVENYLPQGADEWDAHMADVVLPDGWTLSKRIFDKPEARSQGGGGASVCGEAASCCTCWML